MKIYMLILPEDADVLYLNVLRKENEGRSKGEPFYMGFLIRTGHRDMLSILAARGGLGLLRLFGSCSTHLVA